METAPSCCTFYGSAHAGSIQFISHIISIGVLRNSACELPESGTCFPASRTACKVASPSTNRNLSATCSWRLLDTRWLSGAKNTKRPSNILESHHNICHENRLLFFSVSCWFRCVSLRLHFKRNPSVLQTWATSAHRGIEAGFPTCSAVPSLSTPVPGARSTTSDYLRLQTLTKRARHSADQDQTTTNHPFTSIPSFHPLNIRRPPLQQGERVRGEITSSKGQELNDYYKQL